MPPASGRRLLINGLTTWGALAVNVIVGFFLAPIIDRELGTDMLGVWDILLRVIGFSGLVQMALSAGVIRFLSRARGMKDQEDYNRFFAVALVSTMVFGALVILLAFVFDGAAARLFEVEPDRLRDFVATIHVLAFAAVATAISAVLSFVPVSYERIEVRNYVGASSEVIRGVASLAVVLNGGTLVHLAVVQLCISVYTSLVYVVVIRRTFPEVRFALSNFRRDSAGELYRFGFFAFLVKLGDLLRYRLDHIVIGAVISLTQAGVYTVATKLVRYLVLAIISIADVTQPRLASIAHKKELFAESTLRYSRIVAVMAVGAASCAYLVAGEFVPLWFPQHKLVAGRVEDITLAFSVLLIGVLPDLMTSVSGMGLRALNKHHLYAGQNIVEGACNLALSLALAPKYGIVGVAWGTAIPGFVAKMLVQPVYCCRLFGVPLGRYYLGAVLGPLAMGGALTFGAHWLYQRFPADSYLEVGVKAVGYVVVYGAVAGWLFLQKHEREQIKLLLRRRSGSPAAE